MLVANILDFATAEATAGFQVLDRRITPLQNEPVPRHICDANFGNNCGVAQRGGIGG